MEWSGLEGKVTIVSGGASGIGEACVEAFAQQGCRVVVSDVDIDRAGVLAAGLKDRGADVIAVKTDVTDRAQIESARRTILDTFGEIDILVNCAGANRFRSCEEVEPELWDRLLRVNLHGTWNYCRAVMGEMIRKGRGKIVNIGSAAGILAIPKAVPYSTAKHGLVGLTRSLALDLAPHRINVNCICPATVDTPMVRRETNPVFSQAMIERIPLGRLGQLSDMSNAILFLCSDLSDWITGVILPVDGGLTCCIRAHHHE